MDKTRKYYDENANAFARSTIDADVSEIRGRFLKYIPRNGRILDFGCGSGRDAKSFLDEGYIVDAIDGSKELCDIASKHTGIKVKEMDFFDLDDVNTYDGIWACASILHARREDLPGLFAKMKDALKESGTIYASFKYGDFSGMRDGRYFTDFEETSFHKMIESINGLRIVEEWRSEDVRTDRKTIWLNEIMSYGL